MENKAHALMAGLFTILMVFAAIMLNLWFNRDRIERVPYEIATKLSVPGLNRQAAVRYRGLDIGRVDAITFDPKVPGQILIRISIRPDAPITKGTYAILGYQGVTGIAYVQLDDDGGNPVVVQSDKNRVARIEMRPSLYDQLQTRGMAILMQAEELTKRFNHLLDEKNQKALMSTFDKIGNAASEFEAIPRQLRPTLDKLPALTAEAQHTLNSIDRLAQSTATLTGNLDAFATRLQAPDGAVARFNAAADRVSASADRLNASATRLELEAGPLAREARGSMRTFNRTLDNFNERPQSILFGSSPIAPGPGEPGFAAPNK